MKLSRYHIDPRVIHRETFNSDLAVRTNPYHKGTPTALSYGVERLPYGLFNGATSMIDTGSDWIGKKAISISCWIYLYGWGETGKGAILNNARSEFHVNATGNKLQLSNPQMGSYAYSTDNSIILNQWQHIVITRNGTITKFYIDCVDKTNDSTSGIPVIGITNVIIGNNNAQTRTFDGMIADLTVYEGVLTEPDAKALCNGYAYTDNKIGLVGHWPLSENSIDGTTVKDVTGSNNGISINTPVTERDQLGRANQSMKYNGVDDKVTIGDVGTIKTISFWAHPNNAVSRDLIDINGTAKVEIDANGNVLATNFPAATVYVDGEPGIHIARKWHYITITDSTGVDASALVLGYAGGLHYAGRMGDVRVSARELSSLETWYLNEAGRGWGEVVYAGLPWEQRMIDSYKQIHKVLPTGLEEELFARLQPGTYLYNTFGPPGTDEAVCNFVLGYKFLDDVITRTWTKVGVAPRFDFDGTVEVNDDDLPAHTFTAGDAGILTVSSTDGWGGLTMLQMQGNPFVGEIPNLGAVGATNLVWIDFSLTSFTSDLGRFASLTSVFLFKAHSSSLSGDVANISPLMLLSTLWLMSTSVSDVTGDFVNASLTNLRLYDLALSEAAVDQVLADYKAVHIAEGLDLTKVYTINLGGDNAAAGAQGIADKNWLLALAWTGGAPVITTN